MTTKYASGEGHEIVEFLKKDYKEWSSSSESKSNEHITNRPKKLKTLPQAEWREMNKVMDDLKAALPNISPREVRRYYIPYHKAILLELEEEGYQEALSYMKEFLSLDENIAEKTSETIRWKNPRLKDQRNFINCLKDGLIAFEDAKRKDDYVKQATALLDTALFFQSKTWEWWWIAERLYHAALSVAEYIKDDNRQTITLTRYLYGRFLFHELQNPEEALDFLKEARETSKKKTWNASKKLGEKQHSIFKECNILIYRALLILARKERPENPDFALKACTEALERATDAGDNEYVNEALYELGKSYVAMNDMKRALQSFSKLLAIAKRIPDVEGVCNAHMELAFTYKQLEDNVYTEKHLRMCRENAENFGFTEKLADAHYYTGEHYLSQGKLSLSTVHLEVALNMYNKLGLSREADRARSIAGISKGQERIGDYYNLLLECGEYNENATLKICRWKSHREIFWAKKIHDVRSDLEIPYENSSDTSSLFTNDNDREASWL